MATVRERVKANGIRVFHVQVRVKGFPTRTASLRTKRDAERWAKTVEAEMIEGRHFRNSDSRRRTMAEAIDRYFLEEVPKKRDGNMHKSILPWWRNKIGERKLADITPALLVELRSVLSCERYIRANPAAKRTALSKDERPTEYRRSNGTVNRYLAVLSHVFTVARKEWHWINNNPFEGVSKLKESKGRVRYLSEDERNRLLLETSNNPQLHCFVVIALSTACRAGDLLKLKWADVSLKEGRLLFRDTKNTEARTAWLHGEANRLLKLHAKVRRIDSELVFTGKGGQFEYKKLFRTACELAEVVNFRFHDLRHTAATELAKLGATEQQLRAIGGWKSGVVSRYVHLAANDSKYLLERMSNKLLGDRKHNFRNASFK